MKFDESSRSEEMRKSAAGSLRVCYTTSYKTTSLIGLVRLITHQFYEYILEKVLMCRSMRRCLNVQTFLKEGLPKTPQSTVKHLNNLEQLNLFFSVQLVFRVLSFPKN